MTQFSKAIARRESLIAVAQEALSVEVEASGYRPGDNVAPLTRAQERRDSAISAAWLAFNQSTRPYAYGSAPA